MSAPSPRDTVRLALPARLRWDVFKRSLALQASWNPQRMQNLGLLATLVPWLRRDARDVEECRRTCRRYYEFFNTNPYFANFVIGGVLRLEMERAAGYGPTTVAIRTYRESVARSFAGLGDQLFWLGLRPAALMLAALPAFWGWPVGTIVIVALCVVGQMEVRRRALLTGFACGFDIVEVLARPGWHRAITASKSAGKLLTGAVVGCFFGRILDPRIRGEVADPALLIGSVLAVVLGVTLAPAARERLPGEGYLLVAAALVVALGYVL